MKTAIALGTFDGLHKGHIAVLNMALFSGFEPVAVAFAYPPKSYFSGKTELLLSPEKRKSELEKMGFSKVHFIEFEEFKDMLPNEFLDYLKSEFDPALICCGFNYKFGVGGSGDTAFLAEYAAKKNIEVNVVSAVEFGGEVISSTKLRNALSMGDVSLYRELCGRNFSISGPIIHGDARGRTIGYPTANQSYPEKTAKVKFGVYKSQITVDGVTYRGMTNVGKRPTFLSEEILCETYILDFKGSIYGKVAELQLLEFIREEQKFESLEQLKSAIKKDVDKC